MKRKKNITLIFNSIEEEHLGKDVFLTPFYLGRVLGYAVNIVYGPTETNKTMPKEWRGVNLHPLRQKGLLAKFFYLFWHAWSIDLLMLFHFSYGNLLLGLTYKLLHPSGILYVKADGLAILAQEEQLCRSNNWKVKILCYLFKRLLERVDKISIETEDDYKSLCNPVFGIYVRDKLALMLNGFDEYILKDLHIEEKALSQKENIFLTVGRIGSYLKNNEMFLQALKMIDLKGWKVVFIGPIEKNEKDFSVYINSFFQANPHLKDSVLFTGPIYDKKVLWEWYNRAKVFVLTSRSESFGIVLMEAFRFRDYILSTKVGFAKEAISYGYGDFLAQEDANALAVKLQAIIDEKVQLKESAMPSSTLFEKFSWEYQVSQNLKFDR